MRILLRLLLSCCVITPFITSVFAAPTSFHQAMKAYENGFDDLACKMFAPFKHSPLGRRYLKELGQKEEEPTPEEDFFKVPDPYKKTLEEWVEVSNCLRSLNKKIGSKKSVYKRLLALNEEKHPAAAHACFVLSQKLKDNPTSCDSDDTTFLKKFSQGYLHNAQKTAMIYSLSMMERKEGGGFLDARALVSLKAINKSIGVGANEKEGLDYLGLAKTFVSKLGEYSEGEILFLIGQQLTSLHVLSSIPFYKSSALYGHVPAQQWLSSFYTQMLKGVRSEERSQNKDLLADVHLERLYWIAEGFRQKAGWDEEEVLPSERPFLLRLIKEGFLSKFIVTRYLSCLKPEDYKPKVELVRVLVRADWQGALEWQISKAFVLISELPKEVAKGVVQELFTLLSKFPSNSLFYMLRAQLLCEGYEVKDDEYKGDCEKHYQRAITLGCSLAGYQLGLYYETVDRPEDALEAYLKAIQMGDEHSFNNAANLLMNKKDRESDLLAFQYLQKAYEGLSQDFLFTEKMKPIVAYNLALMHMEERGGAQNDPQLIRKLFKEAMEDPKLTHDAVCEWWRYLVVCSPQNESRQEAFGYLTKAAKDNHPRALYYMGQTLIALGESEKGIEFILRAYEAGDQLGMLFFLILHKLKFVEHSELENAEQFLSPSDKQIYEQVIQINKKEILLVEEPSLKEEDDLLIDRDESGDEEVFREMPMLQKMLILDKEPLLSPKEAKNKKKMEKLAAQCENYKYKRQVKVKKLKKLMGDFMKLSSGSYRPATGGGSGRKIVLGRESLSVHVPHGKGHNPKEMTGRRLTSLLKPMEEITSSSKNPTPIPEKEKQLLKEETKSENKSQGNEKKRSKNKKKKNKNF